MKICIDFNLLGHSSRKDFTPLENSLNYVSTFLTKNGFLGSPLLENEDAHSLLLLFSIRLGGLVEEILRLNSFMRSSITEKNTDG